MTVRRWFKNVLMFSSSWVSVKFSLPTAAATLPPLSLRNSILPALNSRTPEAMSVVTVPERGDGISPRGPSSRPSGPTTPIMSGVARATSKSRNPPLIRVARSSPPTMSAPAAVAFSAFSPCAKTATRTLLPIPLGRATEPRTFWSLWRGSIPRLVETSTV